MADRGVLLDSHAFLWALADDARLGAGVRRVLRDRDTALWLSSATVWELGIKHGLGRLTLPAPLRDLIVRAVVDGGLTVLDVRPEHALRAADLPPHHRDPFDRMLVAQALTEHLRLATCDAVIPKYDVPILW